ncbi:Protein kinase domain containing protein [Aphelenchoides avenae]|nr:Protein kinase domain containing protein [Aphelenchus avenae]
MSAKKLASKDASRPASKDSSKPASKETPQQPAVTKQVPQGDHINLDIWHGILPNEDTLLALKNDGDYLLRAYEHKDSFYIVLSIRWGTEILNGVINQNGSQYEFQDTVFNSVRELIDLYHVRKRLMSICGQKCALDVPIRRQAWELRHSMITLEKELGSGAFGVVYRGLLRYDRQEPKKVAVKELSEISLETCHELWREARVMRLYNHPNIVKLFGVANDFTPYYLVMELVPGGSVDKYLEDHGEKLTVRPRVQILIEAAQGIEYLHGEGCIHRDIACRNLLINKHDKTVKVADFGMTRKAKKYIVDKDKPMNLRWLAPEVYKTGIVKKSTDVYAFGCTMYESFTTPYSIPYQNWSPDKVYNRVVDKHYRLEPPPLMPKSIAYLMSECLGEESARPTFQAILVNLRACVRDKNIR